MIEKFHSDKNVFPLKTPCMIDLNTTAGLLTLMMDKEYPAYLFVSFNGELRKCVQLDEYPADIIEDRQVFKFLHELKNTPLVNSLISEEERLNNAWENL